MSLPMRAKRETLAVLALLLGLTFIAASPLFSEGWLASHDGVNLVKRTLAMSYEIDGGNYYPRWLSLTYQGLGSPLFNFYSPGCYLSAAYLHVIGVPLVASIKIVCFALFFGGAAGMYFWTRNSYRIRGSILASVLYLFAPYHFLDVYVRSALPEFSALTFLPYLFLGIDLTLRDRQKMSGPALLAFSAAMIVFFHNISALMVAPFALLYFFWNAVRSKADGATVVHAAAGGAAAVGATAFYWLPVVAEIGYLNNFKASVTTGFCNYANHLVKPERLYSTYWATGTPKASLDAIVSYQIGIPLLLLALATIVTALATRKGSSKKPFFIFFLGLGATLLTTIYAKPVYEMLPWLVYVQFPWRHLGLATLFLAYVAAYLLDDEYLNSMRGVWIKNAVLAAGITLCVLSTTAMRETSEEVSLRVFNAAASDHAYLKTLNFGALSEENEYTSKWTNLPLPAELGPFINGGVPISESATIANTVRGHGKIAFDAASDVPETPVVLPLFYFPGWRVEINGVETSAKPDNFGFITFILPKGRHHVTARFADTLPRSLGWAISAATLLVVGVWRVRRMGYI